jgi:16S rRNA processing protein RimM
VNDQPAVAVGKITRAHGVRGEVAVLVLSEVEERFDPGVKLLAEGHGTLSIEATRRDRGRLLVKFSGVDDRDSAQRLQGVYLMVPRASSPSSPRARTGPTSWRGARSEPRPAAPSERSST